MPNSRSTLLVGFCIIGLIVLSLLRWPDSKPAPVKAPLPETESSPLPPSALAAASRAHAAQKQFAARQKLELQNLLHAKISAWHSEPDARVQYGLLQELCALLTDENAAGIVQSLSADDLAGNFGVAALERWLSADPNAAAEWMASRPDANGEQASLVARMLLKNRDGFQSYLDSLPAGEWKGKILCGAAFEMATSDPQQAIAFAAQMNSGDARGVLQAAAFQWARSDPDAAKQWAEQGTDADLRDGLIAAAAKGMAEQHPDQAAEWLVTSVNAQNPLAEAVQSIICSWATKEPSVTADWVALFPTGAVRDEALETVMNFWTASDPTGARAWVVNLSDGSIRQAAMAIQDRSKLAPTE
jgi:hypothetical protein